jgi:hypothetical protein
VHSLFRIRLLPARLARLIGRLYREAWPKLPRFPSQPVSQPVEKTSPNRFVAILNSAFFLWLLTVCVVSAGGAYVTAYQQCRKDADDEIERHTRIQREIFQRELRIQEIILTKSSVADMRAALLLPNSYFPDYSGFPIQLLRESDAGFLNRVIDLKFPIGGALPRPELLNLFQISNGRIPDAMTDKDIKLLQEYARTMLAQARPIPLPAYSLSPFEPACGPRTLLLRFFSSTSVEIVRMYDRKPTLPKVLPIPDQGTPPQK